MSLLQQGALHEQSGKCWYTRREGVMRGPFSAENISRYILLGRIRLDDELSQDGENWTIAGRLTGLLPSELKSQSSWDAYERLMITHMEADERKSERRSQNSKNYLDSNPERRTLPDRRGGDGNPLLRHIPHAEGVSTDRKRPDARPLRPLLLTVLLVVLVFVWLNPTLS